MHFWNKINKKKWNYTNKIWKKTHFCIEWKWFGYFSKNDKYFFFLVGKNKQTVSTHSAIFSKDSLMKYLILALNLLSLNIWSTRAEIIVCILIEKNGIKTWIVRATAHKIRRLLWDIQHLLATNSVTPIIFIGK